MPAYRDAHAGAGDREADQRAEEIAPSHKARSAILILRIHRKTEHTEMAKGVNKVFLLGNVGKDPEVRTTGSGMTVANFSLATADRAKDAQGNWVDKPEWHNLVCFDKLAETAKNYVKKRALLFVEGKITNRDRNSVVSGQSVAIS